MLYENVKLLMPSFRDKNHPFGYRLVQIVIVLIKHLLHQVSEFVGREGVQNFVETGAFFITISCYNFAPPLLTLFHPSTNFHTFKSVSLWLI
jgi:hypothetical protein